MKQLASWKIVFVAVVIAWATIGDLKAQNNFVVHLNVECDDMELRTITRGFFSRALRELEDVGISNSTKDSFRIDAIAIKEKRGWVLSTLLTEQVGDGSVAGLDPEVAASLGEYSRVIEHSLERGESTDDLSRHIGLLIRTLDVETFKPRRKAMKK